MESAGGTCHTVAGGAQGSATASVQEACLLAVEEVDQLSVSPGSLLRLLRCRCLAPWTSSRAAAGYAGRPRIHIVTGAAGYVGDRQSGHIPVPHQGPGAPTVWAGGTVGSARWLAGLLGNGGIWRGVVCSAAVGEMKRLCTV